MGRAMFQMTAAVLLGGARLMCAPSTSAGDARELVGHWSVTAPVTRIGKNEFTISFENPVNHQTTVSALTPHRDVAGRVKYLFMGERAARRR